MQVLYIWTRRAMLIYKHATDPVTKRMYRMGLLMVWLTVKPLLPLGPIKRGFERVLRR